MSQKHSKINMLKYYILQANNEGVISRTEMRVLLHEEKVQHTIEGLGITPSMAEGLVAQLQKSSTGTNVNVCTMDDFTESIHALVYSIDPEHEETQMHTPQCSLVATSLMSVPSCVLHFGSNRARQEARGG